MGDRKGKKGKDGGRKAGEKNGKLKRSVYDEELERLHGELVKLQQWVVHEGLRVCVVFEGRDGAGKGGTIRAITERVSPRIFRVVALPAPSDREKSQMYLQRYMAHFPAAGEVVIFDRSWYNRAGVEYVMGFCTKEQHDRFLDVGKHFLARFAKPFLVPIRRDDGIHDQQQESTDDDRPDFGHVTAPVVLRDEDFVEMDCRRPRRELRERPALPTELPSRDGRDSNRPRQKLAPRRQ